MKVQLVFSLNSTGSFADDIIHVFSSVRYRLYGKLLANKVLEIIRHRINMNDKVLSHFIVEKKYLSHNNIVRQHLLHKYYFQRAPNQVEKWRKFQGKGYDKQKWGVYKAKVPSVGRGGGIDIFKNNIHMLLHLLMIFSNCGLQITTMQTCYDECLRTLGE